MLHYNSRMKTLRVEFHSHSIYSKDSLSQPRDMLRVAKDKGIDRLVITDHNSIQGALKAKELDPERVIIGEEIMTTKGELLAAFVTEEIPRGLEPLDVIHRLREQGAFISVSHPFDEHRNGSWLKDDLDQIIEYVDAIEVFNSRCSFKRFNQEADSYAKERQVLGTVGSDAHLLRELGISTQIVPYFTNAEELKESLAQARFDTKLSAHWVHLGSRWAVISKKLGLA